MWRHDLACGKDSVETSISILALIDDHGPKGALPSAIDKRPITEQALWRHRIIITAGGNHAASYPTWADEADVIAGECKTAAIRERECSFKKWVVGAIADGAKRAHRWTNAPNSRPPDLVAPQPDGTMHYHRTAVLSYHSKQWATKWTATEDMVHTNLHWVSSIYHTARDDDTCIDIDADLIRSTVKSFSPATSIGADGWEISAIANLHDSVLDQLASLCKK
jgi:hypothetical protein